ncbi:MAG: hypothetical protein LBP59_09360 [Planctomycetaceae bacterium]|nr:hypothetical protein [Planctomycetaceae bacterium]
MTKFSFKCLHSIKYFKLFALEFSFTFACLVFGRQALTLLHQGISKNSFV